ncbi:hypothetical protein PP707_02555 [Acetobacter pasteurianus]|nr:hypothetical protein [Acetobacter pasteurianus]
MAYFGQIYQEPHLPLEYQINLREEEEEEEEEEEKVKTHSP